MDSSILKFRNGVPGYAPQGSRGRNGDNGYSIYYASFGSDPGNQNNMVSIIKQKKILSSNESYRPDDVVNYKSNEMIITNDASVFRIDIIGNNVSLLHIGGIKKISYDDDQPVSSDIPFANQKVIGLKISSSSAKQRAAQKYNYNANNVHSPLWHHRDAKNTKMYGNTLSITSVSDFNENINKTDDKKCKLVINFNIGLRYEKIITTENSSEDIFIENRYFYPYGHIINGNIWSQTTRLSSENEENNNASGQTQSKKLQQNLKTDIASSLCSGYIEFYYNKQEYRIKINLS